MRTLLADLFDLLLPTACAGCATPGRSICGGCAGALVVRAGRPRLAEPSAPACWAGGAYDGPLRALVLAYKERRRHELAGPLGDLLADTVRAAITPVECRTFEVAIGVSHLKSPTVNARVAATARRRGEPGGTLWLVPIPSAPGVARARGGDHMVRLAARAARRLRRAGIPARVGQLLRCRPERVDSVGLSAAARRANVAGTLVVRGGRARRLAGPLVLVDDVVTTGATLAEAARVLAAAGTPPLAAAVLGATPRRVATR